MFTYGQNNKIPVIGCCFGNHCQSVVIKLHSVRLLIEGCDFVRGIAVTDDIMVKNIEHNTQFSLMSKMNKCNHFSRSFFLLRKINGYYKKITNNFNQVFSMRIKLKFD